MQTYLEYFSYFLVLLLAVYARQIFFFYRGLSRLKEGTNTVQHTFSILISARNEEQNIERCLRSLLQQNYPKEKLSIFVIDDQSTDATVEIVKRVSSNAVFPITLFHSDISSPIRSPKIRALSLGIQHSASEIIVTTDADCIASPQWIATLNSYFEDSVGLVVGLTIYEKIKNLSSLFWGMQFLDFISYASIGAGAIGRNRVLTSNGCNMAFHRTAFNECQGFESLTHINAGTDSLLAQKIVASGKWKARFAFDYDSAITTLPVLTWKEVFNQRIRWAGQTAYYPAYMMFFLICTFILFLGLAVTIPLSLYQWNGIIWCVLAGKTLVDFIMMHRFTKMTNTYYVMKYFLPTAVIHIPFILISTIGGYFFSFNWKERILKKESHS